MKIGVMAGAFDLCHAGHMRAFRNAKKQCDKLVVFLHTDPSVERPEKHAPIMSIEERHSILEGIRYIDEVIEYDTEGELYVLLAGGDERFQGQASFRFLGEDWKGKEYTGHDINIPIIWEPREHGFSSSELRARIALTEKGVVTGDMLRFLPDFVEEHWPKGISEDRGMAITICGLLLAEYGKQGV